MKDDTLMLLRLGLKLGAIDHRSYERCLEALELAKPGNVPPTRRLVQAGILADSSLAALWSEEQLRGHVAFGQLDLAQAATVRALRKVHDSYIEEEEDDLAPIALSPELEPTIAQGQILPLSAPDALLEFDAPEDLVPMAAEPLLEPTIAQDQIRPLIAPSVAHEFVPDTSTHDPGMVVSLGASLAAEKQEEAEASEEEVTLFFDSPFYSAAGATPAPRPEAAPAIGVGEDEATLFFDAPMAKAAPKPPVAKSPTPAPSVARAIPTSHEEGAANQEEATLFFDAPMAKAAPKPPVAKSPTPGPAVATAAPTAHEEGEANQEEATLFFDAPMAKAAPKPGPKPAAKPAPAPPPTSNDDLAPLERDDFESAATMVADDAIMAQLTGKAPAAAKSPPKRPPDDDDDDSEDTLAPIATADIENAATIVADDDSVRSLIQSMRPTATPPRPDLDDDDTLAPISEPSDEFGAAATMIADADAIRAIAGTAKGGAARHDNAEDTIGPSAGGSANHDAMLLDDTEGSLPAISDRDLEGTVRRAGPGTDSGEDSAEVASLVTGSESDDGEVLDAIAFTPPRREPTFNDDAPTFLSLKPDAARAATPPEILPRGATGSISRPAEVAPPKPPVTPPKPPIAAPKPPVTASKPPVAPAPTPAKLPVTPAAKTPAVPFTKPQAASAPTFKPQPTPIPRAPAPTPQPSASPVRPPAPRGGRAGRVVSALLLVLVCGAVAALHRAIQENRRLAGELEAQGGPGSETPPKVVTAKDPGYPKELIPGVLALAESIGPPPEADRAAAAFELNQRQFRWAADWCAYAKVSDLPVVERQARHLALAWSEHRQAAAALDAARARGQTLSPEGVWINAYVLDRLGDRDGAAKLLANLAGQPDAAWAALAKAETARAKGQVDEAIKGYADTKDPFARLQAARALRHAGKTTAAASGLEALSAAYPHFAAAKLERAFARLEQGDQALARELVDGGCAAWHDPHGEILAARLEIATGASAKALERLTRVVRDAAGVGEAHAALAEALAKEGRTAEAETARKRAVELEPALRR